MQISRAEMGKGLCRWIGAGGKLGILGSGDPRVETWGWATACMLS